MTGSQHHAVPEPMRSTATAGRSTTPPAGRPGGMRRLWLYDRLDRLGLRGYRAKIMSVAFVGTHIPLISLGVYLVFRSGLGWEDVLWAVGVTLAATLAGTALALLCLGELLRPVLLTSRALRAYRSARRIVPLPACYGDEVGALMTDAAAMVAQLDRTLDVLEHEDDATGLPNRRRALVLVAERIGRGEPFAVAALRFEGFASIAVAEERELAERGAAAVAGRLRDALDAEGLQGAALARVSGSEFLFLLPVGPGGGEEVARRVRRIAAACGGEVDLGGLAVRVALPSGLAFHPEDAEEPGALVDHALSAAARAGARSPVVRHSSEARAAGRSRFRLEGDLHRALGAGELDLHYQPVVDVEAGRVVGVEALLRWRHPERGLVPPGAFVPLAEASELIDEIGRWTLRRACAQIRDWSERGLELGAAVNVSARQLADPELHRHVEEAVRDGGIPPERLEVELTESVAVSDHERARAVLGRLRDRGVGVVIDDFGTGHASLSHLRALSFTKLKIDREFVRRVEANATSQAICAALIELGRGLGLAVLAEGTETEAELRHLRGRGCTLFQGNLLSPAIPAAEVPAAVERIAARLAAGRDAAPAGANLRPGAKIPGRPAIL